jgi:hypothetical protein
MGHDLSISEAEAQDEHVVRDADTYASKYEAREAARAAKRAETERRKSCIKYGGRYLAHAEVAEKILADHCLKGAEWTISAEGYMVITLGTCVIRIGLDHESAAVIGEAERKAAAARAEARQRKDKARSVRISRVKGYGPEARYSVLCQGCLQADRLRKEDAQQVAADIRYAIRSGLDSWGHCIPVGHMR